MASKRLPIVPVDSSAARIPLPGATMAFACNQEQTESREFATFALSIIMLGMTHGEVHRTALLQPHVEETN